MAEKLYGVWRVNNGAPVKIASNLVYDRAREIFLASVKKGYTTSMAPNDSKEVHLGYKWKRVAGDLWQCGWEQHRQDYSQPIVWRNPDA